MNLRHVIVEGPDGSGKDTLIEYLAGEMGLAIHARASASATGPVPDLKGWVDNDMTTIAAAPPAIYNRHPVISEPIYAPLARGTKPQHPFEVGEYCRRLRGQLAAHCVMVWCMPPLSTVVGNVSSGRVDMPGVRAGIYNIYMAYRDAYSSWPGVSMTYDYTQMPAASIVTRLRFTIKPEVIRGAPTV